ncbi:hypothetical protein [Paucibacter soli]|uniref:hypothetical protein n=1 Tax=Paucibacter soli TaxID=3133433 RepID=UPI0030A6A2F8
MTISKEEAQGITRAFVADYPGALELAYYFRSTVSDLYGASAGTLPTNLKGGYLSQATEHQGKMYRGRVDVPLDNMRDAADMLASLRHEVLGHYGINTLAATQKRALLDAVVDARDAPGMKVLWEAVNRAYEGWALDIRAEEVFALQCEVLLPARNMPADRVAAGAEAFNGVCMERQRLMGLDDLEAMAYFVADRLRNRNCPQLTIPGVNDIRRADRMDGSGVIGNPSLRSIFADGQGHQVAMAPMPDSRVRRLTA